jgi:hypothetical protein
MSGTWSLSTRAPVVSSTGSGRRDGDCSMHRAADFVSSLPDVIGQQSLSFLSHRCCEGVGPPQ